MTEATRVKWRSRVTVVALLAGLWAIAAWGGRVERAATHWFEPDVPVVLYFGLPDAQGVGPEIRWLPRSRATLEGRLSELIKGPRSEQLNRSLPEGTVVRSVVQQGDVVTVDFSESVRSNHPGGSAGEIITVYSVVNTLASVEGVERVRWLIEGESVETLVGHIDLRRPLAPVHSFLAEDHDVDDK